MPDHFTKHPMLGLPADLVTAGTGWIVTPQAQFTAVIDRINTLNDGEKTRMVEYDHVTNAEAHAPPAKADDVVIMVVVGRHTLAPYPVYLQ